VTLVEDPLGEPVRLDIGPRSVDRVHAAMTSEEADDGPREELLLAEPLEAPSDLRDQP
jgi:hypothetical protein